MTPGPISSVWIVERERYFDNAAASGPVFTTEEAAQAYITEHSTTWSTPGGDSRPDWFVYELPVFETVADGHAWAEEDEG